MWQSQAINQKLVFYNYKHFIHLFFSEKYWTIYFYLSISSWDCNSHSTTHEFPAILCNPEVQIRVHFSLS